MTFVLSNFIFTNQAAPFSFNHWCISNIMYQVCKVNNCITGIHKIRHTVIRVLFLLQQQDIRKVFPSNDVLYIPIGQAPISCLLLLDDFLWCASGNSVNIIQARYWFNLSNSLKSQYIYLEFFSLFLNSCKD